jgi:hypothetical protein
MSTYSVIAAAVADVRQKFLACVADITPTADNKGYSLYTQAGSNYWTLRLISMTRQPAGKPLVRYDVTAEAIWHGHPVTAGQDGEFEQAAQVNLLWFPAEFDARPYFQSDTYPNGTGYLAPEGIIATSARIATTGSETAQMLGVVVDLTIPLELTIEEGY